MVALKFNRDMVRKVAHVPLTSTLNREINY